MRQRASLGHGDENARKGVIEARAKSAATRCTAMKTLIASGTDVPNVTGAEQ